MKRMGFLLLAVGTVVGIVAHMAHASEQSDGDSSPILWRQDPRRIPQLAIDRREAAPIRRQGRAIARSTRQRYSDQGLQGRDAPVHGWRHHCRGSLDSRPVGRQQQGP
jgi:hypothetical protein